MKSILRFVTILVIFITISKSNFSQQPSVIPITGSFSTTLTVKNFGELPFTEDWSSGGFEQNGWTFDAGQSNWLVAGDYGNPAPSALFYYAPELINYSYALVSPELDATGILDHVTLKFEIELNNYTTATIEGMAVEIYVGSGWQLIHDFTNINGSFPFTRESFNITSYAAGQQFWLRFRAYGENSSTVNWWAIDNIKVCEQAAGNLSGTVTKLSDGLPLEGAILNIHNDTIGTYDVTTGPDGFYTIIGAEAGIYALTIHKAGFNEIPDTVFITGDQTLNRDYALTAPVAGVSPDSLTVVVAVGEVTTRELTVSNTGNGQLEWSSSIQTAKHKVVVPASNGKFSRGTSALSAGRAPTVHSIPPLPLKGKGDIGYAFDIYPGRNFFSFNPEDPASQNVICPITMAPAGGTFDALNTGFIYLIDFNDNFLKKADITSGAVIPIGFCNPGNYPNRWTGISVDKTTNVMYGIATNLGVSKLYTIDMNTGTITLIGSTGIPGAIDLAIDGKGQMYSFDIVNDEAWKVDKTTGASILLGSIGYDANYAQGMGWDPATDIIYITAYNDATGYSELRILDRITGNTTLVGNLSGEVDGLAFPGVGAGWVSIDPLSGTIAPGSTQTVTVTFDGNYIPSPKELSFTGNLIFSTDPEVGSPVVALEMTITGDFNGILEGSATHSGSPVEGVTVMVKRNEAPVYTYTAVTGADGTYSFPAMVYGTYNLTAVKSGFNLYMPPEPVVVTGGQTTILNIALTAPVMGIDPPEINESVPFGTIVTKTITVTNTGDGSLEWHANAVISGKQKARVPASDGRFSRGDAPVSIGRCPNTISVPPGTLKNTRGTTAYAFDIYPGYNFLTFDTDDPANQHIICPIGYMPYGGTFDAVNTDFMYVIGHMTNKLMKV
ncbi:MAG: carboxypeptidase-like regulatory domain-containing protein, partial [Bacteroidota bacterium]